MRRISRCIGIGWGTPSLRAVGLLLAVLLALGAGAERSRAAGFTAYVINQYDYTIHQYTVTPIALSTGAVGNEIIVGAFDANLAITPDAARVYVVNQSGIPCCQGSLTPIVVASNSAGSEIPVGQEPFGIAITPDGSTAYVVNTLDDTLAPVDFATVTPVDLATGTAGNPISVSSSAFDIAISPDGKKAYVLTRGNSSGDTVTPITLARRAEGKPIPVGMNAQRIAITPDGSTAYVTLYGPPHGEVVPIALATNTVEPPIPVGPNPFDVAISPDGRTAYVGTEDAALTPIDIATNTVKTPIPVGGNFTGIAITPDGAMAYVTIYQNGTVTPVTLATGHVGIPISIASGVGQIAITPRAAQGRTTSTAIACAPQRLVVTDPTTCTVTVSDTDSGTASTPSGVVTVTTATPRIFTACTLTGTASSASCNVTYTPTAGGTQTLTASYSGDPVHAWSAGTTNLAIMARATSTSVRCTPGSIVIGASSTCTATVTDTGIGTAVTPAGTVSFTSAGSGGFAGSPCRLLGSGAASSCEVSYTPTAVGVGRHTIIATYSGDAAHQTRSARTTVNVSTRSTSTSIECSPNPVAPGDATSCTATVSDTDSGASITPTGTVNFSSGGTESLDGSPCTLSESSPAVATCQMSFGSMAPATETINASYSGDAAHTASSGSTSVTAALPTSTKGCEIHGAGLITAADDDHAQFGVAALTLHRSGRLLGSVRYRDFGPAQHLRLTSWNLQALTCNPGVSATGSIFGTGKLNRTTTVFFRIDATAGSESRSARNIASYRIRLSNGYDSGSQTPHPGRVSIVIHPR
jgi:DNA-binding beta-propeller fold protein YncE